MYTLNRLLVNSRRRLVRRDGIVGATIFATTIAVTRRGRGGSNRCTIIRSAFIQRLTWRLAVVRGGLFHSCTRFCRVRCRLGRSGNRGCGCFRYAKVRLQSSESIFLFGGELLNLGLDQIRLIKVLNPLGPTEACDFFVSVSLLLLLLLLVCVKRTLVGTPMLQHAWLVRSLACTPLPRERERVTLAGLSSLNQAFVIERTYRRNGLVGTVIVEAWIGPRALLVALIWSS